MLVCGSSHTYRLTALLRERGVECNPTTLTGAGPLENPEQLPDIPDADRSLVLTWDSVWCEERGDRPQTVIRHGDRVLFSEPANWQAVTNGEYESICRILKQKYGDRLQDVVPTPDSEFWLYGDTLAGRSYVSLFESGSFENRGESMQLSPKAVGEILRQRLGLMPRRRALGFELVLV